MGEITEIIDLYIKNSDELEKFAENVQRDLEKNIKNTIPPNQKPGYDTGHLHDSIISDYTVSDGLAVVMAWYLEDYGQYWYRWNGGFDFMQEGLDETIGMYR